VRSVQIPLLILISPAAPYKAREHARGLMNRAQRVAVKLSRWYFKEQPLIF